MSKKKKELNRYLSNQGTLFDNGITEGALDVDMAFRDVLSRLIRNHPESRYQIAAKMSELSLRNISKDMLDKYTSSNQDYAPRVQDLPAICAVLRSIEPAQVLLAPLGYEIVGPEEGEFIRLAKLKQQRAQLDAQIDQLERRAGISR